jgi:hypothetical protein
LREGQAGKEIFDYAGLTPSGFVLDTAFETGILASALGISLIRKWHEHFDR